MPLPELERKTSTTSPQSTKTNLPYPSFSKAHSKEAVGSRENVINPRISLYTPDPTNFESTKDLNGDGAAAANAPPSPPLTNMDQAAKVEKKRSSLEKITDEVKKKFEREKGRTNVGRADIRSQSGRSEGSVRRSKKDDRDSTASTKRSKPSTPSKLRPKPVTVEDGSSVNGSQRSHSPARSTITETKTMTESTIESDSTSIAPDQYKTQQTPVKHDTEPLVVSSPTTPTARDYPSSRRETPALDYGDGITYYSPMPPPPPPPPQPVQAQRVDYLMLNGGLVQPIPKTLLSAGQPAAQQPPPIATQVENLFAPFNGLLEDYNKVISRNGSLAVATGYRSIARRLLDRLEAVFARDISSESCECVLCLSSPRNDLDDERGVSWGEILEYVCGRQELPIWPAFALDPSPVGLGISAANQNPMQKLDVDVPKEYRDHYIRQSKKTKQSINKWLTAQPSNPSSPPQDVDDETLTFAILTHLEPEQRPIFTQLLGIAPSRPASRVGTPFEPSKDSLDILTNTGLAIQRLYRLSKPPRDPESAIYLLNNENIHNVLATLAAVSDGEWEILTSGRFDGFLRSGAEDPTSPLPSRTPARLPTPSTPFSRGTTPFRTSTPASVGAPVAMDEETEIAVLYEVEREIYLSMEALEDAFENLHFKAETVRRSLRERGAGIAMASQARRGTGILEARLGTPASGLGGWESETDDGIDDGASLAPDDSASNAGSSRRRKVRRRNERRTPAPVEEGDESVVSRTDMGRR